MAAARLLDLALTRDKCQEHNFRCYMATQRSKLNKRMEHGFNIAITAEYPNQLPAEQVVPIELEYTQMILLEWFCFWRPNSYPC